MIDELKKAAKENRKQIESSGTFLALHTGNFRKDPDPIILMQLGLAVLLDKPFLTVAERGVPVSGNLKKLGAVEFFEPNRPNAMEEATMRALNREGVL